MDDGDADALIDRGSGDESVVADEGDTDDKGAPTSLLLVIEEVDEPSKELEVAADWLAVVGLGEDGSRLVLS